MESPIIGQTESSFVNGSKENTNSSWWGQTFGQLSWWTIFLIIFLVFLLFVFFIWIFWNGPKSSPIPISNSKCLSNKDCTQTNQFCYPDLANSSIGECRNIQLSQNGKEYVGLYSLCDSSSECPNGLSCVGGRCQVGFNQGLNPTAKREFDLSSANRSRQQIHHGKIYVMHNNVRYYLIPSGAYRNKTVDFSSWSSNLSQIFFSYNYDNYLRINNEGSSTLHLAVEDKTIKLGITKFGQIGTSQIVDPVIILERLHGSPERFSIKDRYGNSFYLIFKENITSNSTHSSQNSSNDQGSNKVIVGGIFIDNTSSNSRYQNPLINSPGKSRIIYQEAIIQVE